MTPHKRSNFHSFLKKLLAFSLGMALIIFCSHFLKPSPSHYPSSFQKNSQVNISFSPFSPILESDLCFQKRGKPLLSKKLLQRKASFLSKNKLLAQIKIDCIRLFFSLINAPYSNYFLVDRSYQFSYLEILSSRSHPPTILSC